MKLNINNYKIIIWGWKDNSNTFYYVNEAFYKAFKYLGANVFWLDDNSDITNLDFANSFFLTEGQVDKNIPLREDCLYWLHNCYDLKYQPLIDKGKVFKMQTYTNDVLNYNITKLSECIYADYEGRCLYYFWPTNLLPHEIEANKPDKVFNKESKFINWVGTTAVSTPVHRFGNWAEIEPYTIACKNNGITFTQRMGISNEENIRLIKESYQAPTIAGEWQKEKGYIACRLMKNISYGQWPLTNSKTIYSILPDKIIYNENSYQLFFDSRNQLEYNIKLSDMHSLMDWCAQKHTYLNRIETIFNFVNHILGY